MNLTPKDSNQGFRWIITGVIIAFAAIFAYQFITAPKPKVDPRKEKIEAFFSGFDGSHAELEEKIKSQMKNPDSYKHVKTQYVDKGETLDILTTFRGTNSFGGIVTQKAEATISMTDGHIIDWKMLE
ncbi:hypothetical protein [Spirosoma harenae]